MVVVLAGAVKLEGAVVVVILIEKLIWIVEYLYSLCSCVCCASIAR